MGRQQQVVRIRDDCNRVTADIVITTGTGLALPEQQQGLY
jgi:hypothetical protein